MSSEGITLIMLFGVFVITTVFLMTRNQILSREKDDLSDKVRRLENSKSDLEWHNRRLDVQVRELTNTIESNIKVGSVFYAPTSGFYKEQFKGTKQKITRINEVGNTFDSIDMSSGVVWSNRFEQIKDYYWVKDSGIKHNFIK